MLFERRPPGHELETQAIVDHREAPRCERDALAVDTDDVLTFGGRVVRKPSLRGELDGGGVQFAAA